MERIIMNFLQGRISFQDASVLLAKNLRKRTYEECQLILKTFQCLDEYDFSEFLTYGRSLSHLIESIENKYDREFFNKNKMYMFDNLTIDMIKIYFNMRYNIWFQEYTDWVVRKEDGVNSKTRKRT